MHGANVLLAYFAVAATAALLCRVLISIPDELFRKLLHCILLGSLLVFVFAFETWWISAAVSLGFALAVYPILAFFEGFKGFSKLTTERKKGELKSSLLLVFAMFTAVISLCWGLLGDRWLVPASIYAWGFGDAAAALVGKSCGKHKIHIKFADEHKSVEGSAAMFAVSFISVAAVLALRGGMGPGAIALTAAVTAAVSSFAELCSKNGMDTLICPISAMAVLIALLRLTGGGI